jgi:hypothetical protein
VSTNLPTSSSRRARWLVLVFVLALAGFSYLCWRDASRPPVRPVSGGTFTGRDVDGRLVQVCLFEQAGGWQGWLYREGHEQTEWFSTTNRAHPWQAVVNVREREDVPKPPEPVVASTDDPLRLNATLPRTNGWASDTANLTRQFEHVSFRRLTGLRLWGWGGTTEYHAQFPKLPDTTSFHVAVGREIIGRCERIATQFNSLAWDSWLNTVSHRTLPPFNEHQMVTHWQLRLLTTNLVSFCVWHHDQVGGNGNHSRWHGINFIAAAGGIRELKLSEFFHDSPNWGPELRARCVPKLTAVGAPKQAMERVIGAESVAYTSTFSPTGLQIYFNPYEIASGADGEFVVHFDYAELKDLLRTDGPAAFLPRAP